jgi:fibronectin type 3 domain-containing protein
MAETPLPSHHVPPSKGCRGKKRLPLEVEALEDRIVPSYFPSTASSIGVFEDQIPIYRSTTSGGEGSTAWKTGVTSPFTDTGLANGTTYYYQVTATDSGGQSRTSTEVSAATIPAVPRSFKATAGNAQVALTWTASNGATSYNLYRSTANGKEDFYKSVTGTSYTLGDRERLFGAPNDGAVRADCGCKPRIAVSGR